MSDRAALVSAVAANPADDLPKLVFADWLDENGDPDRAEFIRLQIAARRESEQSPPVIDPTKLARIRELFLTNYRDWLLPVYEPLWQRLPVFEPSPPSTVPPRTLFGRLVRGLREMAIPSDERQPGATPDDGFAVLPNGLGVGHRGHGVPLKTAVFLNGFMEWIHLEPEYLRTDTFLADALAAEPITDLRVNLWRRPEQWERVNGPHLRRIRTLRPTFAFDTADDATAVAEAICGSEHLGSLRSLLVAREDQFDGTIGAALFEVLRRSPLRRQLTTLSLEDIRDVTDFLTDPDHGFDALSELSVRYVVPPGEADLFGRGVSRPFRRQLKTLIVFTPMADVAWLISGPEWERLELLSLHQTGLGPGEIGALGHSDILPALRELRLVDADLSGAGVTALSRSPLVARLTVLELDGNPISEDGVRALASALDRGLGHLTVRPTHAIPDRTRNELSARYGRRITFTTPSE